MCVMKEKHIFRQSPDVRIRFDLFVVFQVTIQGSSIVLCSVSLSDFQAVKKITRLAIEDICGRIRRCTLNLDIGIPALSSRSIVD
jgi:hypothetical protein